MTFQQIQKYEEGMNRVGASRLSKIAETLDCPFLPSSGPGNPENAART